MAAKKAAKKVAGKPGRKPGKRPTRIRQVAATPAATKAPRARWEDNHCLQFAKLVAEGMTQRAAFVAVVPAAAAWTANTVGVRANAKMKDPRVIAAIAEFEKATRAAIIEGGTINLESHLAELAALRDKAARAGDFSSAVRAEERRGMVAGFYVEKKKVEHSGSVAHQHRAVSEVDALMADALAGGQAHDMSVDGQERPVLPAPLPAEPPRH